MEQLRLCPRAEGPNPISPVAKIVHPSNWRNVFRSNSIEAELEVIMLKAHLQAEKAATKGAVGCSGGVRLAHLTPA